jgi:nuclear transcription factor Y gamma
MDQVNLPGHNKQMRAAPAAPRRYDGQGANPLYDPAQGGHYGTSRPPNSHCARIGASLHVEPLLTWTQAHPQPYVSAHPRPVALADIGPDSRPEPCARSTALHRLVAECTTRPLEAETWSANTPQVNQGLTGNYRDILNTYWQQQVTKLETDEHDYKLHQLPLARIKKVMKADPEVKMISAEAPILFAKGCDIFITELTMRAWIHAEENKRRTLQRSDIASALSKSDMFDFLIDIVPREEAHAHKRSAGQNAAVQSSAAAGGMPPQVHPQHPMAPPDYIGQHMQQQDDFRQSGMYPGGDPNVYGQPPMFDPAYQQYQSMQQQQQMHFNPRGPDPGAGDPQGYRHEEADADAEGEREDFGP